MTHIAKPHATEDLVVVRASDLAALRQLIDSVNNSSDDAGCQDGLTVIDGRPLEKLVAAAGGLRTKPLLESLFLMHPSSEHLESLVLVLPPEVTTEQARERVLAAAEQVTEGLGDAEDPDQDAFVAAVRSAGLSAHNGFDDLGIGVWDAPSVRRVHDSDADPEINQRERHAQ
jgi:hypothetical protein